MPAHFKDVLVKELELYDRILKLSKEKTKVIVEGDTKRLKSIIETEGEYILQAVELEKARAHCMRELIKDKDLIAEECTLSDILNFIPEPERTELTDLGNRLIEILHEQFQINETNKQLININLDYINMLVDRSGSNSTYKTDGSITRDNRNAALFDKRV